MLKLTEQEQTLLRFAAKAAGREPDDVDAQGVWFKVPCDFARDGLAWRGWNPLRDDGDAFRLMVQLRLTVEPWILYRGTRGVRASFADEWHVALETTDRDLSASARLAIVELAAHLYCSSNQRTAT